MELFIILIVFIGIILLCSIKRTCVPDLLAGCHQTLCANSVADFDRMRSASNRDILYRFSKRIARAKKRNGFPHPYYFAPFGFVVVPVRGYPWPLRFSKVRAVSTGRGRAGGRRNPPQSWRRWRPGHRVPAGPRSALP